MTTAPTDPAPARTPAPHARATPARARLRVVVVGGLSRATHLWERAGDVHGVQLEHHDGRSAGRRREAITAAVRRADVVVIITEPNSHSGVEAARRAALTHGRPHLLVQRLRPNDLGSAITDALARGRAVAIPA